MDIPTIILESGTPAFAKNRIAEHLKGLSTETLLTMWYKTLDEEDANELQYTTRKKDDFYTIYTAMREFGTRASDLENTILNVLNDLFSAAEQERVSGLPGDGIHVQFRGRIISLISREEVQKRAIAVRDVPHLRQIHNALSIVHGSYMGMVASDAPPSNDIQTPRLTDQSTARPWYQKLG